MNYENFGKIYKTLTEEQQDIVDELVFSLANMNDSVRQNHEKLQNIPKKNLEKLKGKIKFSKGYNYKEMRKDNYIDPFYSEEKMNVLRESLKQFKDNL